MKKLIALLMVCGFAFAFEVKIPGYLPGEFPLN